MFGMASKFCRKSEQAESPRGFGVVWGRLSRGRWGKLKIIRSKGKKGTFPSMSNGETMLKADGIWPQILRLSPHLAMRGGYLTRSSVRFGATC